MFPKDPVLAEAVHVGVLELGVCTGLEVALLSSLDKIPAAAAAESCLARLGCDWGVPRAASSPRVLGAGRAAGLLAGAWMVPVSM